MRWIAARLMVLGLSMAWVGPSVGEELMLIPRGVEGSDLVVDVVAKDLDRAGSFDLTVGFDASKLGAPRLERGALVAGGMVADNLAREGSYRIAVISAAGVSGEGDLVTLRFPIRDHTGSAFVGLEGRISDLNGMTIPSRAIGASVRLGDAAVAEAGPTEWLRAEVPGVEATTGTTAPVESAHRGGGAEADDGAKELVASGERLPIENLDPRREQEEERWRVDRAARLAGYAMRLRFDPEERVVEDSGRTPIAARLMVFKLGESVAIDAADVVLKGNGLEVHGILAADDGRGLELELLVDGEALPAWLEANAFGLSEEHLVPVYPRVDTDLDGSGDLTRSDYARFAIHFGARKGKAGYEERLDILPDGRIDRHDLAAFRFNLLEVERARRLRKFESKHRSEESAP